MKKLFNEYEAYTEDGNEISDEFRKLIDPFLDKVFEDCSAIELKHIMTDVVDMQITVRKMLRSIKTRKGKGSAT